MLLDQKRTKRMIKIVAVLTAIAFAGIGVIVIGAIFLGGGSNDGKIDRVSEARSRVERQPDNPSAWDQLAVAQHLEGKQAEAVKASRKAISLAPTDFRRVQTLVRIYTDNGQTDMAIEEIQGFIEKNPKDPKAFLQLGSTAEQAQKSTLARLSYQKFLELDPQNPSAPLVRQRIKTLSGAPPG